MATITSRITGWTVAPASADRPVTLRGPLLYTVRALWLAVAAASVLVWVVETPLLFHSALQLHNTNGMFMLSTREWRAGLLQVGLTANAYAVVSIAGLYLMTATMFVTGLLIFWRRSRELIALLVSYVFIGLGAGIINGYAGGAALIRLYPALAVPVHIYGSLTDISYYGLFVLPLLFPDGRFAPRWMRWVFLVGMISIIAPLPQTPIVGVATTVLIVVTVFVSPVYRYLRVSGAIQREQTKWALFGMLVPLGVSLGLNLLQAFVPALTATPRGAVLFALIGGTIAYLALGFLPIGFAIAILRYKLWEIDALINRTLVYAALTLTLAALYIGSVVVLQALFRAITGQGSVLAVAISTLTIAALFNPWRRRLQKFVDRRFYRHKYDAARTLAAFQAALRDQVDMDQLSNNVLEVVQNTMQPAAAAFWVREDVR